MTKPLRKRKLESYYQDWNWRGWWLSFRLLFAKSRYAHDTLRPSCWIRYKVYRGTAYIMEEGETD